MFQDVRLGVRMLFKNFGFTAVVVLTLALGIGANVALFSIVNSVLLNPLPFPEPDQLVTVAQSKPNFEFGAIPYPNFLDLQKENKTFSAMAVSRPGAYSLIGAGEPERVSARQVSADFFSVLGLKPVLGRGFAPGEDQPGVAPLVMISADLWQRKFGSATDVIGKGITLDDKAYTVIGVVPPNFSLYRNIDVYVPIGQWNGPAMKVRAAGLGIHGIGRMKPGVTIQQARSDLNGVMARLAIAYPETNRGNGASVSSMRERMIGGIGPTLWMLLGAVGFVLLIACVNVSNLLLARSTTRSREFAIRSALGAGRWRLLRQSLTESMLMALLGGGLGLLFAAWGTKAAITVLPTTLPRAAEVQMDLRVLFFAIGISVLTGVISGLGPALKTSKGRLSETLKEGGRGASGGRTRAHGVLVAAEMALAVVLLIGAGLMVRSLGALWNVDTGFRSENLLTYGLSLPPAMVDGTPEAVRAAWRELGEQIKAVPGVQASSFSLGATPLQGEDDVFFWLDSQPKPTSQSEMSMALIYRVEPDYLNAMGIPLKQGRFFTEQDNERTRPVVVIDEVFARKHFGSTNPIGQRIRQDDQDAQEVVGVVGHVKQWSIHSDEAQSLQAQLYEPFRQLPDNAVALRASVITRSSNPGTIEAIRRVVNTQNQQNVISRVQTMDEVIAGTLADRRFLMILLQAFAGAALLLASLGLYGVISYLVGQRTHELGIRMALGAQRGDVLRLVLNHGMKMALGGVAIGLVAAVGLTRLMSKMLYGVSATDPITFIAIALLLTSVALLACLLPARRATKVDPLVALRYE